MIFDYICSVPAVPWSNSLPNLSAIEQSTAELFQFYFVGRCFKTRNTALVLYCFVCVCWLIGDHRAVRRICVLDCGSDAGAVGLVPAVRSRRTSLGTGERRLVSVMFVCDIAYVQTDFAFLHRMARRPCYTVCTGFVAFRKFPTAVGQRHSKNQPYRMSVLRCVLSLVNVRLPSNLRLTTRECLHLVTRVHFRSLVKGVHHSSCLTRKPRLLANITALCLLER